MPVVYDRVKQSSTSTGTGDFTLSGSATGFRDFSEVFSVGDQTFYCITADDGKFEVGQGAYSAADTLQRATVFASSNSDAKENFQAGSKTVFVTYPAAQSVTTSQAITFAVAFS